MIKAVRIDYLDDGHAGVEYWNDMNMAELNSEQDAVSVYSFDYHCYMNGYQSRIVPSCFKKLNIKHSWML